MIDTATLDRLAALKRTLPRRPIPREVQLYPARIEECRRKKAFTSRIEAEAWLRSLAIVIARDPSFKDRDAVRRPYPCLVCSRWHVTTNPRVLGKRVRRGGKRVRLPSEPAQALRPLGLLVALSTGPECSK